MAEPAEPASWKRPDGTYQAILMWPENHGHGMIEWMGEQVCDHRHETSEEAVECARSCLPEEGS